MADVVVRLPSPIDPQGNIYVHGRAGIYMPVKMWSGDPNDPEQSEVNISASTMTFEVEGVTPIALVVDPNDTLGLLLDIPDLLTAGIDLTGPPFPPYIIRDSTGTVPIVRMQGEIIVAGWQTT